MERLNLTRASLDLARDRLCSTGVRLSPTVERLNLATVSLDLAQVRLYSTGVRLRLIVERLSPTVVDLSLTCVRFHSTRAKLNLTWERFNPAAERLNLTVERLNPAVERLHLAMVNLAAVAERSTSGNASRRARPSLSRRPPEDQKEKIAELVREIEEEAVAQRAATGSPVLGRAAILKQHPHERPNRPKKSYAPLVHAASRKVRRELYEGYRAFVAAYREAADRLREGNRAVIFPAGSFPPALPFVGG